jgi:hypothetical protein
MLLTQQNLKLKKRSQKPMFYIHCYGLLNLKIMTQEKANKIFATELGQQLNVIYVTSDDQPFIRYEEAALHTNELLNADPENFVDTSITEWYPED